MISTFVLRISTSLLSEFRTVGHGKSEHMYQTESLRFRVYEACQLHYILLGRVQECLCTYLYILLRLSSSLSVFRDQKGEMTKYAPNRVSALSLSLCV